MLRNVSDMDIKLLRMFSTIVKCGGFTPAQAELNISQSNISMQISALEKRLGYRLCERGKGGFSVTPEGQEILQSAAELFDALDKFKDKAQGLTTRLVGDVYIGLADNIVSLPDARIHAALARFYTRQHDVRFHIIVNSPAEMEMAVIDRQLDLAISYFSRELPTLNYQPMYSEQVAAYCGSTHPLSRAPNASLDQLKAQDWVRYGFLIDELDKTLESYVSTITAYHLEGVLHAVLAGTHLGHLPLHYAKPWVDAGQLIMLEHEDLRKNLTHRLITHSAHTPREAVQAFIEDLTYVQTAPHPMLPD